MAYITETQRKREQLQKWGTGPTKQVRPMLPNSYDATEKSKWGTSEYGQSQIPMDRYQENNRKMYTMEDVPETPRVGGWQAPTQADSLGIASRYGGQPAYAQTAMWATQNAFTQTGRWQAPEARATPTSAGRDFMENKFLADNLQGPPMPPPPTGDAWQRREMKPALARLSPAPKAAERWGGPSGELSRPMGQGALDMTPQKRMDMANDSAAQSYDYYARKDARRFGAAGRGRSRRSDLAF